METLWLSCVPGGEHSKQNISAAAAVLCTGGVVAIPTETVYGLAANAFDEAAVAKIFEAKGRPQDNPLIVHIAEPEDMDKLCEPVPDIARRLALRFWPGPLTIVLKAKDCVPKIVTAGLETVAIRCPSNPVALAIIREAGVPCAAPSANISGSPSPTDAAHVKADLNGRIDAIVAAGTCEVGLESTIVDLSGSAPRLLRPGGITKEQLLTVLDSLEDVDYDENLHGSTPPSPGMKYRHYAPNAPLTILRGDAAQIVDYINRQKQQDDESPVRQHCPARKCAVLVFEEDKSVFDAAGIDCVTLSRRDDPNTAARKLYSSLRKLDAMDCSRLYAQYPSGKELWYTVRNRLLKAAGQQVLDIK